MTQDYTLMRWIRLGFGCPKDIGTVKIKNNRQIISGTNKNPCSSVSSVLTKFFVIRGQK